MKVIKLLLKYLRPPSSVKAGPKSSPESRIQFTIVVLRAGAIFSLSGRLSAVDFHGMAVLSAVF